MDAPSHASMVPATDLNVNCPDQDEQHMEPTVPGDKETSIAPQRTPPPTHLALASHAVTWNVAAAPSTAYSASDNGQAPSGADVIHDDGAAPELPRTGKKGNKLPPRKPISKKKKGAGGPSKVPQGVRRGNGFSQGKTDNLLELLHDHVSLAKEEWEKVARLHELRYPQQRRNADSLRRKFSSLCRTFPPTGDPSTPQEVLNAKEIRKAMTERADIGEGDGSGEEYTEELNDETSVFPRAGTPQTIGSSASAVQDTPQEDATQLTQADPLATQNPNPSPRPLVRKRPTKTADDEVGILGAIKVSTLQEQMRRDAKHRQRMLDREEAKERREDERLVREQERKDERERRAEERSRSEQMTQMMMIALLGPRAREIMDESTAPKEK